MSTEVVNKRTHIASPNDVYIGRGSKWGNPFIIGRDGSRSDVVRKYGQMICERDDLLASIRELKGKNLVCFCSPQLCHGDILKELADTLE